jgi:TRAP-type mannitol/chloroaromatic compound transport system permease small subunit
MKSIIVIWFIIFVLLSFSLITGKIPFWVPATLWLVSVLVRAKEKIENYFDTEKKSKRDEKLQFDQKAEEMAGKGMAQSSFRVQEENRVKEDFEFERRKKKRKLWVDLIDALFLK